MFCTTNSVTGIGSRRHDCTSHTSTIELVTLRCVFTDYIPFRFRRHVSVLLRRSSCSDMARRTVDRRSVKIHLCIYLIIVFITQMNSIKLLFCVIWNVGYENDWHFWRDGTIIDLHNDKTMQKIITPLHYPIANMAAVNRKYLGKHRVRIKFTAECIRIFTR